MGTNYYYKEQDGEQIHIGKQSGGWAFTFNPRYKSKIEWEMALLVQELTNPEFELYNEYREAVTRKELFNMIEKNKNKMNLMQYWEENPGYNTFRQDPGEEESIDDEGYRIFKHSEFC